MDVLFFPALGLQLSWSERPADNREVTSSNLVRPTTLCDNSHPNVSRVAVGVIIKTFWAQPEVSTGNQLSWESAGFASLRSGVRSPYSPPIVQGQGFCPWPFCLVIFQNRTHKRRGCGINHTDDRYFCPLIEQLKYFRKNLSTIYTGVCSFHWSCG